MVCIDDETPFEVPQGWEWTRLRSLVYNHGQVTPNKSFCYIDIGSIDNKHQKLNPSENTINPVDAPSRARRIVELDDILYSTVRPYLHNMCIVDRQFSHMPIASTGFAVMACHKGILNRFLFLYLQSPDFDRYANDGDNAKGVAYPAINDDKLYKALIPVPPTEEQIRITDYLNKLFPLISRYEETQNKLDVLNTDIRTSLRKSFLQEAVQGRLVPQDTTDEPAMVLLERIRVEKKKLLKEGQLKRKDIVDSVIFKGEDNKYYEKVGGRVIDISEELPIDIPSSWAWCRLGSVIILQSGQDLVPERYSDISKGIPYITGASNLANGAVLVNRWTNTPTSISHKGDLLITCKGTVGAMAYNTIGDIHIARQIMSIHSEWILIDYVEKYLEYSIPKLEKAAHSIIPGISRETILSTLIPIPPLEEQSRIIGRLREIHKYFRG